MDTKRNDKWIVLRFFENTPPQESASTLWITSGMSNVTFHKTAQLASLTEHSLTSLRKTYYFFIIIPKHRLSKESRLKAGAGTNTADVLNKSFVWAVFALDWWCRIHWVNKGLVVGEWFWWGGWNSWRSPGWSGSIWERSSREAFCRPIKHCPLGQKSVESSDAFYFSAGTFLIISITIESLASVEMRWETTMGIIILEVKRCDA